MKRVALTLLVAAVVVFGWRSAGNAQGGVDVRGNTAQTQFPNGLAFHLDLGQLADDVSLVYEIAPDGVRATAQPQCTTGVAVSCSFLLPASGGGLLIPGAVVTYFWRITAGGATQETDHQVVAYEDTRFDWKTVSDGNVTLWYYGGSESDARAVLTAARESLDRISALLQTSVTFPVKVFYYGSAQDMQAAVPSSDQAGVVTLGEVVFSDTAMVAADYSPEDIARHEVAHIVVREATRGPYNVPDWLNEGTAVFAQSQPLSDQRQAIEAAIASGDVLSVRSISSASVGAFSDTVSLFYGESWSLVKFLVDTYGDAKFASLFQLFKDGTSTGDALQQVYGFNQDGLENAWRQSVGLSPRIVPTPNETVGPTPNPTVDDTPEADNGGANVTLIVVIATVTAVLAFGLLAIGVVLARRYR